MAENLFGYQVLATLGRGAGSVIYKVQDDEHKPFALKHVVRRVARDRRFLDQALCEHEVARHFLYPSLRRSFKVIRRRSFLRTTEVAIVMELVEGESLESRPTEDVRELCRIMREVAHGLHEMHCGGYVHADIKPNNILITADWQPKIIDFGQSCPVGTVKERIQGTPDYIAPEQVLRRRLTPETDVFNFGATLYWLLTKRHVPNLMPKRGRERELRTTKTFREPAELNAAVPPALSRLVMDCLHRAREDRPSTMPEVTRRLDLAIAQIQPSAPS
jgi:serine/threonine-protein kinase